MTTHQVGLLDTPSFLPTSLSPVRTGSYDTLLILLSLLEPVLTGESINPAANVVPAGQLSNGQRTDQLT